MKILYVTTRLPHDLTFGDSLRAWNHIKYLSKKHKLTLLGLYQKKDELKHLKEIEKFCKVIPFYQPRWKCYFNSFIGLFSSLPIRLKYNYNQDLFDQYSEICSNFDLVYIQALQLAYLGDVKTGAKKIIDLIDVDSLLVKRKLNYGAGLMTPIYFLELSRLKKYEKTLQNMFDKQVVISDEEKEALGLKNTFTLHPPMKKELYKFRKKDNIICISGNMSYLPTVEGIVFFVIKTFPLIKKEVKDVKLKLIGVKPTHKIKVLNLYDSIEVTGEVKNLAKEISKCKVSLAPLMFGCGVQMKMVEAMASCTATVMTSIVNKGIGAKNKKETLVADTPEIFANSVIDILKNEGLRKKLESNAIKFVGESYSFKSQDLIMKKIIS